MSTPADPVTLRVPEPRVARRRRRLAVLVAIVLALFGAWLIVHKTMPDWYARLWYPLDHAAQIREESARHDLDPALVAAVIYRESGFVPDSRSDRGAVGLMQVLPPTARFIARQPTRPSPSPDDLEDPDVNIAYGTWYLRYLIDRYDSVPLALAAYNAGEANVGAWLQKARATGRPFVVPDDIPFPETRGFVKEVQHTEGIYRRAYRDDLSPG